VQARTAPQGQQQQQRQPGNFMADTRQQLITLAPMVPATAGLAGVTTTQQLPTSGYLSGMWFILSSLTTTAAVSSTTVKAYPQTPFNLIRQIRIYNNMGVDIWRTTGYEAYLYMRSLRSTWDPQKNLGWLSYALTDSGNNSVFSRFSNPASSLGASTTETVKAGFYLPTAWGTMGQAGLQLLQDDAVKWYLEITWGDVTDLYSATTGTVTLSSQTLTPVVETFATPRNPKNRPDLSYSKIVRSEVQAFDTGAGTNTYKFVTGDMLTRLIHYLDNGATLKPLDPTQVTNLRMTYASTQMPYNVQPDVFLFRESILRASIPPQGVYCWELAEALGLPEFPTLRDVVNTIKLTNLNVEFTLAGVTPSSSGLHTITERLSPNRRQ